MEKLKKIVVQQNESVERLNVRDARYNIEPFFANQSIIISSNVYV